jgi:hypothetical protein
LKAAINKGTEKEIVWSIDDPVTPELVHAIETAGDAMSLEWNKSPFMELVELLLTKFSEETLEEMMYDEDPEIIEIGALALKNPLNESTENIEKMVRLYLPVMVVLLHKIKGSN